MSRRPQHSRRPWHAAVAGLALLPLVLPVMPAALAQDAVSKEALTQDTARTPAADQQAPAVITADELVHDRSLDTVTARGHVEINYGDRILLADTVNYQVGKDYATASGNVVLVEPDGSTLFADHVELSGKLKDGFAHEVRILLADGSRAAAREAVRTDGNRTELTNAVYSACDSCADDPSQQRIWQIKAMRVVHDQAEKEIRYDNAWLEMWGIPVLYTPYMSHADPSVKQRSGLLPMGYRQDKSLGLSVSAPYYIAMGSNQDLTLTPTMTSNEGPVLAAEYRWIGMTSKLNFLGSITRDSDGRIRNHVDAEAQAYIDDTWRTGIDLNLASDDTYMRRYGYGRPSFLTTRPYIEGFQRRSYTAIEGYYFQNLLADSDGLPLAENSPLVVPVAEWSYVGAPGRRGAWHSGGINAAMINRETGTDSRRLSMEYGWHVPYVGPIGDIYRMDLSVRGDVYDVTDATLRSGTSFSGTRGRLIPEAALTWSLPLARSGATFQEVVEPIVMGIISPQGQNPQEIPNEDSLDFEFDDTNLFSTDRFTGYDRIESGFRLNYGLRYGAYGNNGGYIGGLIGQSWRPNPDSVFTEGSGLSETFSDLVGRVTVRPTENVDFIYRFRLDNQTLAAQRNEIGTVVGPAPLRVSLDYAAINGSSLTDGGPIRREEITVGLRSEFSRYWTVGTSTRWNLEPDAGPLRIGAGLKYDDECFTMELDAAREFTRDRDYEGGFAVGLRLVFKTLGDIETSVF